MSSLHLELYMSGPCCFKFFCFSPKSYLYHIFIFKVAFDYYSGIERTGIVETECIWLKKQKQEQRNENKFVSGNFE